MKQVPNNYLQSIRGFGSLLYSCEFRKCQIHRLDSIVSQIQHIVVMWKAMKLLIGQQIAHLSLNK